MNILLIGSGGREHAIAAKLIESSSESITLYAAPGNPGIFSIEGVRPAAIAITQHEEVVAFCREHACELVVIGPEAPLAAGLADDLNNAGIPVFGPSRLAAQLESSKGFAKEFMMRHGIPTAQFCRFQQSELAAALDYVASVAKQALPVVIKADGLAAGKGVVIAETSAEALRTVEEMLGGRFGEASSRIVIEEFMYGEEASVFAVCDGERFITLAPAQDHKRIGEGDTGENTGGMGAYAPAPLVTDDIMAKVHERIIAPTLRGMKQERMPFVGCLFVGLIIHNGEPKVVEFNARFGDPETQAVLAVLKADFAKLLYSAACGHLQSEAVQRVADGVACCVVLAAKGYPGEYAKGMELRGIAAAEKTGATVFHAGTMLANGTLVANGGRVLGVTGKDATLKTALDMAYTAVEAIEFDGKTFRHDIGIKGLQH